MTLSALIRKRDTGNLATAFPAISATQPKVEAATVARIATVAVANPKEGQTAPPAMVCLTRGNPCGTSDTATVSRWWLIHYPDRDPVEVACFPDVNHAEILERYPDAVSTEPISQASPAPVRACKTCQYRPPGYLSDEISPCGNQIAAGLSDLPGVIRYSPDSGATCKAWLAKLDPDLEQRIRSLASRWKCSHDEVDSMLAAARSEPDGWLPILIDAEVRREES